MSSEPRPTSLDRESGNGERSLAALLRAAYDRAPGCPGPEAWSLLAAGESEARRELLAHAETCPACAAERDLALLYAEDGGDAGGADVAATSEQIAAELEAAFPFRRSVEPPAERRGAAARTVGARGPLAAASGWLAAAAVVLVLIGSWQIFRQGRTTLPDPVASDTVRSGILEARSPAGDLPAPPTTFEWTESPRAASYRIELRRVDDELLWQRESPAPASSLQATELPSLSPGVVYLWTVAALGPSGEELGRSHQTSFRVRPESPPATVPGDPP